MSERLDMEGFAAASLLVDEQLYASGKAMVKGLVGEFVPSDREKLSAPIPRAAVNISGLGVVKVLEVTQRPDVAGWSFQVEER